MNPERLQKAKELLRGGMSQAGVAKQMRMSKRTVQKIKTGAYDTFSFASDFSISDGDKQVQKLSIGGITRDQVRERHDTPARLMTALDAVLLKFQEQVAYEENEIRQLCRVSNADNQYWEQVTSLPKYASNQGYTEKGARLWGAPSEIAWMINNVTGFRGV